MLTSTYLRTLLLTSLAVIFLSQPVAAQERLCDTAFEDCRQPLWNLIDAETVGIDVAFWFMQDTSYANKLITKWRAGVPVRVLVDPRANPIYSGNEQVLDMLEAAGIPMRYNITSGILHWKMMLFAGQNKVEFSGANFSPAFFVPTTPFQNYIDEVIYFTDDPDIVNSFKTQYDNLWIDTSHYANYANITGPLTREYPVFPIHPDLNFPPRGPGSEFVTRTLSAFSAETQQIDVIMYRITDRRYTDSLIAAHNRGINVRLMTEPEEYRNPNKFWHSWNVDRMYVAGISLKHRHRNRLGLNHEKAVITYSQGLTIFGSSNWTTSSSNSQEEHNYFTTKPWFFNWFINHFDRKWNSSTEYEDFAPLPPDPPTYLSPANNATDQSTTMRLRWEGGLWAHKYDVYFGTDPTPPLIATDHIVFLDSVYPGNPESYNLPTLQPGTKYYWRIVSKTMANMQATGPVWSFTTAGTPPPTNPPTVTGISPNSGSTSGGTSVTITGTNFASGATVTIGGTPATNVSVVSSTSITAVTPAHSAGTVNVVVTNADGQSGTLASGFTYTSTPPPPSSDVVLWAGEATVTAGSWNAVADSTAAGGMRMSSPDFGAPKISAPSSNPANYFEMSFEAQAGTPYRLWIRARAQNDFYGNDSVWVQFSDSQTSSGTPVYRIGSTSGTEINLEDCSGCGLSGWGWQDNGWGVGVLGPLIYFQSTGTHTIRIQIREDGVWVDQIVLSSGTYLNTSPGALKNDSTIMPKIQ
jgi:phosphatidylserine/phosphatidylglycerophosphate/cardiolipin synthase-like enzyme